MFIYVGYVISDYAHALVMGLDEKLVEERIKFYAGRRVWYVEKYKCEKDKLIELDCD